MVCAHVKDADPPHSSWLLRLRGKRRGEETAGRSKKERAPVDHFT
jgi:hypothetical protein